MSILDEMKLTQSEMINRLARWVILLTFSVLVTSGCSDESSEDPCNAIICENGGSCLEGLCDCGEGFEGDFCENVIDEDAPTSCFELTIIHEVDDVRCNTIFTFVLDASCTMDNVDPLTDLKVRWDFDNDGSFDTEFDTIKVYTEFRPIFGGIDGSFVTMEARDQNGNSSIITQLLDLDELPKSPDLIAGKLTILDLESDQFDVNQDLDTVMVDQQITFFINYTCWGEFGDRLTTLSIDGQVVEELDFGGCNGTLFGCNGSGVQYTFVEPGTYIARFDMDVAQQQDEVLEDNNFAEKMVVVID